MLHRRSLLTGLVATAVCAPALVRVTSLMTLPHPVRVVKPDWLLTVIRDGKVFTEHGLVMKQGMLTNIDTIYGLLPGDFCSVNFVGTTSPFSLDLEGTLHASA